ncbi:hypothetical protein [Amycolatopsis albispora]|uniref:5-bromo-4-chloroindolyl phosphate hydrolysis protein n=1 Tax=Amycolatopsis albispora TaxID=1804986 RepID=A0A344L0X3_9PSEU|nr:hypothetical protein [Amycolatopsis albispora]AXB41697.1 hypothetical protein A4R43_03500 [Amycolatopsis albispora]
MIRYLGSTKNLAGCVGGLLGLVLYLTGVVGSVWPLVVAGLYAAGALLAPPEKVHLVPDAAAEAGQLRTELETLVRKVSEQSGRMPPGAVETVRQVAEILDGLFARPQGLRADPDLLHAVTTLARTDLPQSVETYLNLPWWVAAKRLAGQANSAGDELLTQLGLLRGRAEKLAERFYSAELNQQADHTRYLRDREREDSADG